MCFVANVCFFFKLFRLVCSFNLPLRQSFVFVFVCLSKLGDLEMPSPDMLSLFFFALLQ